MEKDEQMNRLVQGDVGSGKTIIAILAMFKAWKVRLSICYDGSY